MKILITTGIYPPDIGGPATYAKLLKDKLPDYGFKVRVQSYGWTKGYPKIVRYILFSFRVLKNCFWADIIYTQDTVFGLASLFAARISGKHFLIRVPGDYAWEQSVNRFGVKDSIDQFQSKSYGWRVELLRKIQKFVVNKADKVITPSIYFKKLVSGWVSESEKVVCIYNGIDLTTIPSIQVQHQPKTILSAGRLVAWKGFAGLIRALVYLPEWRLSIIGSGPLHEELKEVASEVGVASRVIFFGDLPRKQLIEKIQESEVFVLNTSFESFSFVVVEAMAVGTPVITTNIGNLKEIIDDGRSGYLVDPNDEMAIADLIKRLSSDHGLRNQLINNAREKAQQFSLEHTLNDLCAIFQTL